LIHISTYVSDFLIGLKFILTSLFAQSNGCLQYFGIRSWYGSLCDPGAKAKDIDDAKGLKGAVE
jgi:hypothetical protein